MEKDLFDKTMMEVVKTTVLPALIKAREKRRKQKEEILRKKLYVPE